MCLQYENNPAIGSRDIVWKQNTDARHSDDNIPHPISWAGDKNVCGKEY